MIPSDDVMVSSSVQWLAVIVVVEHTARVTTSFSNYKSTGTI